MTFIKPSTATGLTSPYAFKGTLPSVAQNYLDLNFPNALDKTGDNVSGATIAFTGSTVNFNASSVLTINQTDTLNMFGILNLASTTVVSALSGVNFIKTTTLQEIIISPSTTAITGGGMLLGAQSTTASSSTGGALFLASGNGTLLPGQIIFAVGSPTVMTLDIASGLVLTSTIAFAMSNASMTLTNVILTGSLNNSSTISGTLNWNGSGGGGIVFDSGANLLASSGSISNFYGTTNINNGLGATTGGVFNFTEVTVPITVLNGANTLTSSQFNNPNIYLTVASSLTGTASLVFPASPDGIWFLDVSNIITNAAGNSFGVTNGGNTESVIIGGSSVKFSNGSVFIVRTRGSVISVG